MLRTFFAIILLFLSSGALLLRLSLIFRKRLLKYENRCNDTEKEFARLSAEKDKLKSDSAGLMSQSEETVALYDITKEICKHLDPKQLFACFKERLAGYIKVEDCMLVNEEKDIPAGSSYTVIPLKLNLESSPFAYLAASGIKEDSKEKFSILASQFLLGLKRALLYKQVQELSITDSLTGIFTRRYFLERFDEELQRSKKFNYFLSVLMIDIDHFKDFNDRFGHLVGDIIIKVTSQCIKDNIRQIDMLGRYGGEEFAVILPETDRKEALFVAGRIREAVLDKPIKAYDEDLKVTISIGVSVFPDDGDSQGLLIEKSDQALYRAKNGGRNQVSD